ncbi:TraI [Legionella sainthelensi]|uniref:TraI n=1 Tax=Legionella sainthelensi TaxID=28087 RepID=A0A0W0YQ70_9GAMM|nr:toprim domain-containing protein [Legionella sainthelensi]KTD58798.1 TraI [Legionella sainthelensi]VEH34140.1 conjugative transfer relaxase protein TraI [Legionella sainthelensi]
MNIIIDRAKGQWPEVYKHYLKNKHRSSPVCGGKDRFRFDDKEGKGTFYCNKCGSGYGIKLLQNYHKWSFSKAVYQVAKILGIQTQGNYNFDYRNSPIPKSSLPNALNAEELKKRRNALTYTWLQIQLIRSEDPVDCYLKSRGISLKQFPVSLRYHPHSPYYDEKVLLGYFPARVALVRNQNNGMATLHRTYLVKTCKANVPNPKKLMPSQPKASVGAAIKLYQPVDGKIALAEGIETALSIHIATKLPAWATISVVGMDNILLPPYVKEVIITVDNDESGCGQQAAYRLTKRLLIEGRTVKRAIPSCVGKDFVDMLLEDY